MGEAVCEFCGGTEEVSGVLFSDGEFNVCLSCYENARSDMMTERMMIEEP